jgi:hypothetical protein
MVIARRTIAACLLTAASVITVEGCTRREPPAREITVRRCAAEPPRPDYFLPTGALVPSVQGVRTLRLTYAELLGAMGERSLYCDSDVTAYRVARLDWNGVPLAIAVQRAPNGSAQLTMTKLEAPAWNLPPGSIFEQRRREMTASDWNAVEQAAAAAGFWTMKAIESDYDAVDGEGLTWILEGSRGSDYHIVSQWGLKDGPFRDAGLRLLTRAGVTEAELLPFAPGVPLRPPRPQPQPPPPAPPPAAPPQPPQP